MESSIGFAKVETPSDENLQRMKTDGDLTEPEILVLVPQQRVFSMFQNSDSWLIRAREGLQGKGYRARVLQAGSQGIQCYWLKSMFIDDPHDLLRARIQHKKHPRTPTHKSEIHGNFDTSMINRYPTHSSIISFPRKEAVRIEKTHARIRRLHTPFFDRSRSRARLANRGEQSDMVRVRGYRGSNVLMGIQRILALCISGRIRSRHCMD